MTGSRPALLLGLLVAGPILPHPAAAGGPQCGPREALVAILADRHGETRRAIGLAQDAVMELFASEETGTWTIAVTAPDGSMCLVAAGEGYQAIAEPLPARGARI